MSGAQQRADKAREDAAIWEALANEQIEAQRETAKAAALRSATLEEQNKKLIAELTALQAAAQALPPKQLALAIQQASDASEAIELDEAATRKLIDRQLHDAGWQVDSQRLTFERGVRPTKGKNLAIAEWPTLAEGKDGWADYVLFAGLQVLAVVEAKRKHKDVVGVIPQAKRYSFGYVVKGDEHLPEGSPWGQHKVPFLFATNGRPFLRQLRTKSGIWFLDARRSENHPVPLEGWYTPEGLLDLLKQDIDDAHARLKVEPMPYVDREYQKNAILAVERGLEQGKRELRTPRRASQKFRLWTSTTASSWTSATAGTCSTATPALHTKEIFGAPVFSYSYREAAEGRTRRSDARAASGAKWRRPREWREQRPRQFPETEEGKGHTRSGSLVVLEPPLLLSGQPLPCFGGALSQQGFGRFPPALSSLDPRRRGAPHDLASPPYPIHVLLPEVFFRGEKVVRRAPQLEVLHRRRSTERVRVAVMHLEPAGLPAALGAAIHVSTPRFVAFPDRPPCRRRDVAAALSLRRRGVPVLPVLHLRWRWRWHWHWHWRRRWCWRGL